MKFLSFFFIFIIIIFTITIKLLIVNQESEIRKYIREISEIDLEIEKMKTDISYSTRPQKLERINEEEFGFFPVDQSDIIKLKSK